MTAAQLQRILADHFAAVKLPDDDLSRLEVAISEGLANAPNAPNATTERDSRRRDDRALHTNSHNEARARKSVGRNTSRRTSTRDLPTLFN